jgi:large subunit ribosomal protein L29
MKSAKAKDLRERSVDDLKELEKKLASEKFAGRFKNFTNRLDDTSVIKNTRRELARVKTLLVQKNQAAAMAASAGTEAAPKAAKLAAPKAPKAAKTATEKTTKPKATKAAAKSEKK